MKPVLPVALFLTLASCQTTLRYVFSFGDSYTSTSFDPNGTLPTPDNIFGNPPYPGQTSAGGPNWIGDLVQNLSPNGTISWNFAHGGATVDNSIATQSTAIPDFVDQVTQFKTYVNDSTAQWTAANSAFLSYFGTNDIDAKLHEMDSDPSVIQNIISSYYNQLDILYQAGGRRFVVVTMDPLNRTPVYQNGNASNIPIVTDDVSQWNDVLSNGRDTFASSHTDADVRLLDSQTVFNTILDNPTAYGAPDNLCTNSDGVSCLWADALHPAQAIHKALAQEAYSILWDMGFYKTPGSYRS